MRSMPKFQAEMSNLDRVKEIVELSNSGRVVNVVYIDNHGEEVIQVDGPLPKDFCQWLEKKYRPKGSRRATPYPQFYCRRHDPGVHLEWIVGTARRGDARFYLIDFAQLAHLCRLASEMPR